MDSCIEPVLLSTQDNVYLYNVINKSDISADGKWVLYLDNYKSSGDMGRYDNFDLHIYNVDNRSDTIIATDIQDAKFTLDGKHLVYCKMPQDYVDNGNTNNKKFTIVDLKTMNESKTYAEGDYGDNIDFTGLWAIKDNGDILIFNGMPGTGYYAHAVYLIRNDKLQVLLNFDSDSYGIVTNKELNDMFVIKNNNIYYYDIDNMKNVELGEDYRISIPILSKRRNFLYNIDSLDKMVFASEDGVYLWNKAELKLEKVLSMDWHSGEIIVIDYSDSDMLIAFDKSKICRVENLSNKPLITTLFSTSEGIIEDIMYDISAYQPTDDNIWFTVEENEDYIFYAIDKDGNILHKVSGELIDDLDIGSIGYIPSASQYTLMAYNYNDEEHLYSVDSDVREVKLIENRAIKHTYCDNSLWTVYMVTDGMVCMYNGEKVINIGMPELD